MVLIEVCAEEIDFCPGRHLVGNDVEDPGSVVACRVEDVELRAGGIGDGCTNQFTTGHDGAGEDVLAAHAGVFFGADGGGTVGRLPCYWFGGWGRHSWRLWLSTRV